MVETIVGDRSVFAASEVTQRNGDNGGVRSGGSRPSGGEAAAVVIDAATKRVLDVIGTLLILIALSPLLFVVAALVKTTSPGPVLFKQSRYGRNGKIFSIYKFRTMIGAPRDASAIGDPNDHAARITPVGDVLRRYCIDELPQLFNVLLGDMSLVGPRAHPVGLHVLGTLYEIVVPNYHERHGVRPGMTGLAQVLGLSGIVDSIDHAHLRVAYDILYIARRSAALDLTLIAFTGWRFMMRGGRGNTNFPIGWFIADQASVMSIASKQNAGQLTSQHARK